MSPLSAFLVVAAAAAACAGALPGYQQPVGAARGFADPRAAGALGYGGLGGAGGDPGAMFRSQIYTDPAFYGYESTFPGGRTNFKAYRSVPEGAGIPGGAAGAYGDYDSVVVAGRGANRPGLSPQLGAGLRGRY